MYEGVRVYFDTMLYLNKFGDEIKVKPETQNMFAKVKSGEFRLVVSQLNFLEVYHVMCLRLEKQRNIGEAKDMLDEIRAAYADIKNTVMHFPNTEVIGDDLDVDVEGLMNFAENVPGSNLIDFISRRKLPGSMDFLHIMIAVKNNCSKFFTEDKGVLALESYQQKGDMKIIKPYRA